MHHVVIMKKKWGLVPKIINGEKVIDYAKLAKTVKTAVRFLDNVIDVIKNRRSIRKYVNRTLLKSEIEQIIDAGRYAPSAHDAQPWKFIVITDKAKINYLSEEIKGWFRIRARLAKIVRVFNAKVSRELETAEKMLSKSELTEEDAEKIGQHVKEQLRKRFEKRFKA